MTDERLPLASYTVRYNVTKWKNSECGMERMTKSTRSGRQCHDEPSEGKGVAWVLLVGDLGERRERQRVEGMYGASFHL